MHPVYYYGAINILELGISLLHYKVPKSTSTNQKSAVINQFPKGTNPKSKSVIIEF